MGPQNRNHISKTSRFRVTGQIRKTKKWPKYQMTLQIIFEGTSQWYQSIGLTILHHMLGSTNSFPSSSHNHKNIQIEHFQYVSVSHSSKIKLKCHFTDFTNVISLTLQNCHEELQTLYVVLFTYCEARSRSRSL